MIDSCISYDATQYFPSSDSTSKSIRAFLLAYDMCIACWTFIATTIGVPRILQWRGFTWWGPGHGVWGTSVPQKLKQNVKLAYNF